MTQKLDFILLIDDDEATGFLHRIMAEESGITDRIVLADSAEKGIEALRSLTSEFPTAHGIIFLDINMPVMDGWMFLDELRAEKNLNLKDIHIYMVSASDFPRDLERIQSEPLVNGYVPKPLTAEKIRDYAMN